MAGGTEWSFRRRLVIVDDPSARLIAERFREIVIDDSYQLACVLFSTCQTSDR